MFKAYLQHIDSVEIYALISFLIFFLFFIAVTIHTLKMDKKRTGEISRLPLEKDTGNDISNN